MRPLTVLIGSTSAQASGMKMMSFSFLWIPMQRMRSSARQMFQLYSTCYSESGSTGRKIFHMNLGSITRIITSATVNSLGVTLLEASLSSIDLKYSFSSWSRRSTGRRASMEQPEKAPGSTWMNLKMDSKGLSMRWAKWYSICCAFWISKKSRQRLVSQLRSSSLCISSSSTFSAFKLIYPHTPPTCGRRFMQWYILYSASGQGRSPTSSRMEQRGFSQLHSPLKNQLCDDSLPEFLYFITNTRFTYRMRRCSPYSVLEPLSLSSRPSYVSFLKEVPTMVAASFSAFSRSAMVWERERVGRRQAEMQASSSLAAMYWLHSYSELASSFIMVSSVISKPDVYRPSSLMALRAFFCWSMILLRIILRLRLEVLRSFFMFCTWVRSRTTLSYSSLTLVNLRSMRSLYSSSGNKNLLQLSTSPSSTSVFTILLSYFLRRVFSSSSSKKIQLSRSNSSKQVKRDSSTFWIPSMMTATKMSSGLVPFSTSRSILSAMPSRVRFNMGLSSLYMHTQIASSIPSGFFSSDMQLSCWFLRSDYREDYLSTYLRGSRVYLLSLMPAALAATISPCGRVSVGTDLSFLWVRRANYTGFMKPTLTMSYSLTWDIKC